jgi:hypothetical protein
MSFTKVFTIVVVLMAGFLGLKVVAPWSDNWRLKAAMQESVNQASLSTDAEVISSVLAKAKELQVPLDPREIHLERRGPGGTRLWAAYDVTLTFPLGFSHTQRFRPAVRAGR